MNGSHLPAGRGGHTGPGGSGTGGSGSNGQGTGSGGGGGGGGRGGGGGGRGRGNRGRYYGQNNHHHHHHHHHNNNSNGNGGYPYGQNYNPQAQYPPVVYPGYASPYGVPQYGFPQMPYMQGQAMPNGFLPYQSPPYGAGRGAAGVLAPQYGGVGIPPLPQPHQLQHQHPAQFQQHAPSSSQPQSQSLPQAPSQPHSLPQPPLPQQLPQQLPQPLPHLPQPNATPFSRNAPQPPLVVSTPQPQQLPPPPPPFPYNHVPQQSPPVPFSPNQPPPVLPSMGLPPSLPPHIPPPSRVDLPPTMMGSLPPQPPPAAILHDMPPPATPSTVSTDALPTPISAVSAQPSEVTPAPRAAGGTFASVSVPSSNTEPSSQQSPSPSRPEAETAPTDELAASLHETEITMSMGQTDAQIVMKFPVELPWHSAEGPFPPRSKTSRNRRRGMGGVQSVDMPLSRVDTVTTAAPTAPSTSTAEPQTPKAATAAVPATTTPTPTKSTLASPTSSTASASRTKVQPAVPLVAIPSRPSGRPQSAAGPMTTSTTATTSANATPTSPTPAAAEGDATQDANAAALAATPAATPAATSETSSAPAVAAAPVAPMLWSKRLFSEATALASGAAASGTNGNTVTNGHTAVNGTNGAGAFAKANANSLAEAIASYRVGTSSKVAFLEPRGLINTGNMCYMNSVLQVLIFCRPFYDFLDQVGQKKVHSFKSDTPMIDAMISFMREFKVIDRAQPADLQLRLKSDELERYGEAFIPEFVYSAIHDLPRFSNMNRGQQQDAQEFLGFLLQSLDEECAKVLQDSPRMASALAATSETPEAADDEWYEVGRRQRSAVTQSSGRVSASPVSSIFGGVLRSELRVPGRKDSVTLEPYQSLQLHIDSPEVRDIIGALRMLTVPEVIEEKTDGPRGREATMTKQVLIEQLPPVLILHLKRFHFDPKVSSTIKIGKKIGYPLELEIPRELFSRAKRNAYLSESLPKYRLHAVVYHHGKNAGGGHYTVDVLREDGCEWVRLDDTLIRRIHREEVAEEGAEESGTDRADAMPNGSAHVSGGNTPTGRRETMMPAAVSSSNRFAGMADEETGDGDNSGWSVPVNGNGKKWSSVANGSVAASAASKAKMAKTVIKDNKVAYLLFYERIN